MATTPDSLQSRGLDLRLCGWHDGMFDSQLARVDVDETLELYVLASPRTKDRMG